MDWSIIVTIIGTMFSTETLRFLLHRKTSKRVAEAEADTSEFNVLKETIQFLQVQLKEKEERFADQTNLVRRLHSEVLELTQKLADETLGRKMSECLDEPCPYRQPPKAYTPPRANDDMVQYFNNREKQKKQTNDYSN